MLTMERVTSSRLHWTAYFDRRLAIEAVSAHIAQLPSSRTEEQNTRKVYEAGLKAFTTWMEDDLPTVDLLRAFIAHMVWRGLKSSTIASRYLAVIRHYLHALANQSIPGLTGEAREFVADCREQLRQAEAIQTPKPETSSNIAPLWRPDFHRLDEHQVNRVLRQIDRTTVTGLRDYALMHIAFSTGLRLAELARIRLAAIFPTDGGRYLIRVRGKRNNVDPVPMSRTAYRDLQAYIEAFNAGLDTDDPRRIVETFPVWQPRHRDRYYLAIRRYDPSRGISHQAIRDIIAKRSLAALGYKIAAHDTRRTAASLAHNAGMPLPDIQQLLRHKHASITLAYIGTKPNFEERALDHYVAFG